MYLWIIPAVLAEKVLNKEDPGVRAVSISAFKIQKRSGLSRQCSFTIVITIFLFILTPSYVCFMSISLNVGDNVNISCFIVDI